MDKLQAMQDEFEEKKAKKEELEANIALCKLKLERAEKLLDGLGGEKTAWGNRAKELTARLDRLTGDVLLASGYRERLYFLNHSIPNLTAKLPVLVRSEEIHFL